MLILNTRCEMPKCLSFCTFMTTALQSCQELAYLVEEIT